MRKIILFALVLPLLIACDKHDPILPGVRTAIFSSASIDVKNREITDLPTSVVTIDNSKCPYTQDTSNVVWDGDRRIFSGFPTTNTVAGTPRPICSGKYIYAGLTTGEVIKVNPKTRQIAWIADVYRASNLTGGASMVDIVAPLVPVGKYVYAGGLGDAFCKLSASTGDKIWCLDMAVSLPFVITETYAFVVSADRKLYAVALSNGDVMWRTELSDVSVPVYENGVVTVAGQSYSATDGKKVLDK